MTSVTRRAVLAMPAVIPAAVRAQGGLEQREVQFIGVRDPQLGSQLAVADQYGLFREQGLTVNFNWVQSAGDVLTVMGSGAPMGVAGPFAQIVLASQNIPVKIVTGLADISDTQGLALRPGFRPSHPRELEGKKLAFTQGNSTVLLLPNLARRYGFDHTKVQLVNMNPSEGVVAASKGDVDGMLGWQPFLHRLVGMGGAMFATGGTLLFTPQPEVLPDDGKLIFAHSCIVVSQSFLESRPNVIRAFLRALIAADGVIASDRPRALEAMQRVLRIEPEPLLAMAEANKYRVDIGPKLVAAYRFTVEWAVGINRIPGPQTPESGISTALLESTAPDRVLWRAGA